MQKTQTSTLQEHKQQHELYEPGESGALQLLSSLTINTFSPLVQRHSLNTPVNAYRTTAAIIPIRIRTSNCTGPFDYY